MHATRYDIGQGAWNQIIRMKRVRVRNILVSRQYVDRSHHNQINILATVLVKIMHRALRIIRISLACVVHQSVCLLHRLPTTVAEQKQVVRSINSALARYFNCVFTQ